MSHTEQNGSLRRMSNRLPWQRGDRPNHFISTMPEGTAEIWLVPIGSTAGPSRWCFKIRCGETIVEHSANDKQHAADQANDMWPDIVRREQARVAKIDAHARLEAEITAAHKAGRVDVMAFSLGSSEYGRLIEINEILRHKGWLDGPLYPLVKAVSEELYRRRRQR